MPNLISRAPDHPDALRLIAGSEAEQSALYPPEARFAFSPQELIDAGVAFLVAYGQDGEALGCGGMAPYRQADPPYGELKRIYSAPAARGRGVARRLIAALEAEGRARGLGLMRLETGVDSPAALHLYAALGYARRGPFGDYPDAPTSVFMEKAL
ncbi:MAG: GNAT family N-acetyltransferase [Pseudomonadota bacterium]